jgi:hypothetical protein
MGLPKLFTVLFVASVTTPISAADARVDCKEEDAAKLLFKKFEKHSCVRTDTDLLYARKIQGQVLRDVFLLTKNNGSYTCWFHAREAELRVSQDKKTIFVSAQHVHFFFKDNGSGFISNRTWGIDRNVQTHAPTMAEQYLFMEIERLIVEWEKAHSGG